TAVAGKEFSYAAPDSSSLEVDGAYYIYNAEKSVLKITPKVGEDNVITLVYDKFEGTGLTGDVISEEGATCWFADPRSLTAGGKTFIGYIDVHGSVKAAQYDNTTGKLDEVLVRSNFQPDDHNNPTFLELPDGRIMIFYSRHTDEACFYYRISKEPYDITTLGEEKYLATSNNTTYPSPFILSDDPEHIYLCWRGINWHPTLGRLSMPDENDNVTLELEKQIVQSTGARPYAKYTSNGKDELWVTYTTGHPDNEDPNWLYFNKININTLDVTDINGNVLSNVDSGPLSVNKTTDASRAFAVSAPSGGTRNWVWEIVNDNGTPVIAQVKIDSGKSNHNYYCTTYKNGAWQETFLTYAGGKFHSSNTEYCYSGGMTIDKANPHVFYCSVPVEGVFGKVFEIVKYTMNEDYSAIESTEYITSNSKENNVRPYVANGSTESDLRLTWMNGYYQYWMVKSGYPDGFPTRMMTDFDIPEQEVVNSLDSSDGKVYAIDGNSASVAAPGNGAFTISMELLQSDLAVGGNLLKSGNLEIVLEKQTVDPKKDYAAVAPKVTANGNTQKSDNLFSNSDWFTSVLGTNGDKGVNSMGWINYTVTYDGADLVTYVNGLIDANLQNVDVTLGETVEIGGIKGIIANVRTADAALTQAEVKAAAEEFDPADVNIAETIELGNIENIVSDLILPQTAVDGQAIEWASSDEAVIDKTGAVTRDADAHTVTLTATVDGKSKEFTVT
ncbi:MAG: BNR-4 repeat-containing protein, partial [Clostridia bacterium]